MVVNVPFSTPSFWVVYMVVLTPEFVTIAILNSSPRDQSTRAADASNVSRERVGGSSPSTLAVSVWTTGAGVWTGGVFTGS